MSSAALLRKAAEALEAGENPFSTGFLTGNSVTLDQLSSLADQIAIGARIIAAGIEKPKSLAGRAMFAAMAEQVMTEES